MCMLSSDLSLGSLGYLLPLDPVRTEQTYFISGSIFLPPSCTHVSPSSDPICDTFIIDQA